MENKIKEALEEIKRGTSEIIDIEAIEKLLKKYFETGENFYVKAGFDPTAPDLHLGHTNYHFVLVNTIFFVNGQKIVFTNTKW